MAAPAEAAAARADGPVPLRRVAPGEVKALALSPIDDATMAQAGAILRDVRVGGEAKLVELGLKFGDLKAGASTGQTRAGTGPGPLLAACASEASSPHRLHRPLLPPPPRVTPATST